MLKIAVCDDELVYLKSITGLLREILNKNNLSLYKIDTYSTEKEFILNKAYLSYDVIFLDINMPETNGLAIAKEIRANREDVIIVFITAFIDYAIKGYESGAIRFLLKDMLQETLPECMDAIIQKLSLQTHKLKYSFVEGEKEIAIDSIFYIESQEHKMIFYVKEKNFVSYSLYGRLDKMEVELLNYNFLRIHKSFLVNAKYIKNIANYKVYLENGKMLPIPRAKFQEVKERYFEIMGDMI